LRRVKETVYATMQPPVPPLPPRSASMGVEGVGSGSGAEGAMEKSVAKKSIDDCVVERRQWGATDAVGLRGSPSFIRVSRADGRPAGEAQRKKKPTSIQPSSRGDNWYNGECQAVMALQ
jgi:hypothetical protein